MEGEGVLLVSHRDSLHALDPETLVDTQIFPPQPNDDDIDVEALYGSPAAVGSHVFVPTYDNDLFAIDLEGRQVWSAPFETDGSLIGGVIFVPADDAGEEGEPPLGMLFFGSDDGNVYAVESDNGIPEWSFETGDGVWSTPAYFEGVVYATSLDGSLYALDAETGNLLWEIETDAGIASTPVVNEEERLLYVGGFDGELRAIDIDTQEQRWSAHADNWFWTTPLLADGVVYAGALDNSVHAVDAATGEPIWSEPFEADGPIRSAPAIAGDVLIVATRDGHVHGINRETGADAFSGPLELDDDVFADLLLRTVQDGGESIETVLVMTTGGDLVEIDPETLRQIGSAIEIGD